MKPRLMKRMMWSHTIIIIAVALIQNAVGQSNYASHANNVDYLGKGLPEEATLDGKVSKKKNYGISTKKKKRRRQVIITASIAAISIRRGYRGRVI